MYPFKESKTKIFVDDSELTRIIKHLNPEDNCADGRYEYIKDLIAIKVGKSGKYKLLIEDRNDRTIDNIGELEIHNYKYDQNEEMYVLDTIETFVHLISNASHIRGQKVLFVNKRLYPAIDEILRCGVDNDTKTKYISKWTSYYGLQASNSVAVTMPKCTIIPDLYMSIEDIFDIVRQEYKNGLDGTSDTIDKFSYDVVADKLMKAKTCPFDGMGVVDVEMAKKWSVDLGLDYIPGSFQIRLCGVKGCLFVMPINDFVKKISQSGRLRDIDGNVKDYEGGDFNVILTESMFKYKKFYNEKNKVEQWKREFDKEVQGYKRTFNICSYSVKYSSLKDSLLTAYQPLQTLDELLYGEKNEQNLSLLCDRTVDVIKAMYTDIPSFLNYIGIDNDVSDKESVKPYYRALAENHSLCNDSYIKMKMERTLESAKEKAYVGKLYMEGNYTVVGSDPFALLQHAFNMEVTGLLEKDEIYSNYWNKKNVETVNVWRNPHIFREHWIGKCNNTESVNEWFRYLDANIIVSIKDTNLLRCNSADTDGDTLASVKNSVLEEEVKRILEDGKARTIYPDLICDREGHTDNSPDVCISDTKAIIMSEIRGFSNDIGDVINKISELWGEKQCKDTEEYIKILSVVGSLVIDFVKTGIKVPIPKEILKYISKQGIKKLRFMMYLPNNRKIRKQEERDKREIDSGKRNGKFESKFSDKECTLNNIMNYMKSMLEDLEPSFGTGEFDYLTLIKSRDSNLKNKTQYARVKDLIKGYVKDQKQISDERKREDGKYAKSREEYNMIYKAFYDKCRNELLCVCDTKGKLFTKSMILDCSIVCCYTEFKEDNYSHFDLLWNLFPEELVKRAAGKDANYRTKKNNEDFQKSLEEMREKSNKKYEALKNNKKNRIECLECDKKTPENFNIYKSDITSIKNRIPTSIDSYIVARKVYFCYLVAFKRLRSMNRPLNIPCLENSKNEITNKCLVQITGLDSRQIKKAICVLESEGIIKYHCSNNYRACELLFVPEEVDIDKIYYNGINYMRAFNVMNRYL